jgi:PKD repeat protein
MRVRISVILVLLLIGLGCNRPEEVNKPPSVGFTYTPDSPSVGTPVEFSAEATDLEDGEENQVESFEWSFGDGGEATGPNPTHTYEATGNYDVIVTVTDDGGRQDSESKTVEVQQ